MALESFTPRSFPAQEKQAVSRRSQAIYEALQREIILGMLAPRSILLELELAQRFGASQGSVREGLLSLQEEGLVHRLPHRGTTVADCRADDAEELIWIRHDIECRGVVRALRRHGPNFADPMLREMEAMQVAAEDEDEYSVSVHDRAFHMRLYEYADLPSVQPVLARSLIHAHRFKILHATQQRDLADTANRHQGIVDALVAGDADRAVKALSHHITTIVDFGPNIITTGPVQR